MSMFECQVCPLKNWPENICTLYDLKHEEKSLREWTCLVRPSCFTRARACVCVCVRARLPFKLAQRSMRGECAAGGGREEQGFHPFHPQLHRSSVVEVCPATVQLRPAVHCRWHLPELLRQHPPPPPAFSHLSRLHVPAGSAEWPQGGADTQETNTPCSASFHIAPIRWIKCVCVWMPVMERVVCLKRSTVKPLKTHWKNFGAVSFKLSGKQMKKKYIRYI